MDKLPKEPPSREITPESLYARRREFLKNAALFTVTATGLGAGLTWNSFDGDSNVGGNAIGGLKFAGPFFAEVKAGIGDVPDFKIMGGMTF